MLQINKTRCALIVVGLCMFLIVSLMYYMFFGASHVQTDTTFVVGQNHTRSDIIDKLKDQQLIKSKIGFVIALYMTRTNAEIAPGGYSLSPHMNAWDTATALTSAPSMKWIIVREGLRKEQIGELLDEAFDWSEEEVEKWNTVYTKMDSDYVEGTYFPDTYLIPVDEDGLKISKRLTRRFNEQFEPYITQFAQQNIKWTTGLTLASIIQREAAGREDMPLIAGILWNRLQQDMKLEIDATVQYARGKTDAGWWAPITPQDITTIDSPYNTYKHNGLPPHPISNPGLDAINAVLHPAETDCLYYLHDNNRVIHCAETYEGHKENIEKYLRNE